MLTDRQPTELFGKCEAPPSSAHPHKGPHVLSDQDQPSGATELAVETQTGDGAPLLSPKPPKMPHVLFRII